MRTVKDVLQSVFSVERLAKDPTVVFAMDSDLWVRVNFLMYLEEFKRIRAQYEDIVQAAVELGFEYKAELGIVRKKFSVPRTQVLVGGFSKVEDVQVALEKFDFISVQTIEGKEEFLLSCYCEEHAVEIALFLMNCGKTAVIEPVDTFLVLYENVLSHLNRLRFIPFFYEPVTKVYSVEEVKSLYFEHEVVKPSELAKFKNGVIGNEPRKFVIFD